MSSQDLAKKLKNVSEKDRKQIEQAQEMLGPDPSTMGFIKNLFWGNFREDMVFPYPEVSAEETARCDQLVAALDEYLRTEHPTVEIDQKQEIPEWAIKRLFELGVMGMIIPQKYGGGSYGLTSYNRVLKRIGQTCGSTAVMVSAHQSIGCGALVLFGTDDQKERFLAPMAKDTLSAFCLSEPNVGCDAGGQETYCEKSADGEYFTIISGEKKWATSAAMAGLFTVMTKQKIQDPATGKVKEKVTALICTPDMEGVDIFSRNRSKASIRGTWQARIRFKNVKVPKENLLHKEGKGLNVALTCLNYGRCTLSAGMVGAAQTALEQGTKWAQYRHQFDRPLAEFELVQDNIAAMSAYLYATEAMLFMSTGMVDRGDDDIMLETAICKVFCSELGYQAVNRAVQIMGGEAFMTENELERIWRDSRINTVVEGANEVMHSFVFAYGSKQLGEYMIGVKENVFKNLGAALRIGLELYCGLRRPAPHITKLSPKLAHLKRDLEQHVREFSHQVKMMFKVHEEGLITNQMIQRRLSESVVWIHAMTCCLSRVDRSIRAGVNGTQLTDEISTVEHVCAIAGEVINMNLRGLRHNSDATMRRAAHVALRQTSALPNSLYAIPEKTPDEAARGTGHVTDQTHIQQFGAGSLVDSHNFIKQHMNTFDQMIERGHERVTFHQDPASGLRVIVAVHSTVLGPGFGGARRWHYATEADALYDVLRLSEGMTYKAAAANIPMGGGKAVIMLPKIDHPATEIEARAMGRFVESLGGLYISAEDVGLTPQYADWMAQETRWVTGGIESCPGGDPSPHTAQGVVNAMKAALAASGRTADFANITVAIQGAGNVGRNVARILHGLGARLLISDINAERVKKVAGDFNATPVAPEEILTSKCEILAPCALGGVIDATLIRKLRCEIICGGANNILDDYDEDGVALHASNIVYVPDFVANAGGVIQLAGAYLDLPEAERQKRIADIEQTAAEVLRSAVDYPSTFAAAVALAKKRIAAGATAQVTAR